MQKKPKYGTMKAADMFLPDAKQVFCRKSGEYIRLEIPGTTYEQAEIFAEPEPEKPKENPAQTKLF